ncbi:MAG: hypothetical protein Q4E47_02885 [Candidatus Saccharibacteria bacterium]|nr:hypothetical protein [Candidatus Saccharibacteria bacterium]
MKQSDIISIVIIAAVGTLAAFFGVNAIMGNPDELWAEYKTIKAVTTSLKDPDPELFNQDAINPTVEVFIGVCQDKDLNGIIDEDELAACQAEQSQAGETDEVKEETDISDEDQLPGEE